MNISRAVFRRGAAAVLAATTISMTSGFATAIADDTTATPTVPQDSATVPQDTATTEATPSAPTDAAPASVADQPTQAAGRTAAPKATTKPTPPSAARPRTQRLTAAKIDAQAARLISNQQAAQLLPTGSTEPDTGDLARGQAAAAVDVMTSTINDIATAPLELDETIHPSLEDLGLTGRLPAVAAPPGSSRGPQPASGPTTGGTRVSVGIADPVFTDLDANSLQSAGLDDSGRVWTWGMVGYASVADQFAGSETVNPMNMPAAGLGHAVPINAPDGVTFTKIDLGPLQTMPQPSTGLTAVDQMPPGAALSSTGDVWTWGGNVFGQLGDGSTTSSPTTLVKVDAPAGVKFTDVAASSVSVAAIDTTGRLWAWGSILLLGQDVASWIDPVDGGIDPERVPEEVTIVQDEDGFSNIYASRPIRVDSSHTFSSLDASYGGVFAIDTDGDGWSFGARFYGGLGEGFDPQNAAEEELDVSDLRPAPMSFPAGIRLTAMHAGLLSSMARDDNGDLWTWGIGAALGDQPIQFEDGQPTMEKRWSPVKVIRPAGVTWAAAAPGLSMSAAVDTAGRVWTWGANLVGEIGQGQSLAAAAMTAELDGDGAVNLVVADFTTPVPTVVPVEQVATDVVGTGASGTVLLLDTGGRPFGWGNAGYGQVGDGGWERLLKVLEQHGILCPQQQDPSSCPSTELSDEEMDVVGRAMIEILASSKARTASMPQLSATAIAFDGYVGDELVVSQPPVLQLAPTGSRLAALAAAQLDADDVFSALTPAHDAGTVDVDATGRWANGPYAAEAPSVVWAKSYTYVDEEAEPSDPPTTATSGPVSEPEPTGDPEPSEPTSASTPVAVAGPSPEPPPTSQAVPVADTGGRPGLLVTAALGAGLLIAAGTLVALRRRAGRP